MTHTTVGTFPHVERRTHERRSFTERPIWRSATGLKISWGGINGGVFVAVGTGLLLSALGLAIGISAVDPRTTDAGNIGTSAAIWSGLSMLVALYIGGYAATRLGATTDATTGFFEGALVWVVSIVLMMFLAGNGIGMATKGAFSILGGATEAVSTAVGAGGADLSSGSVDEMVQKLEDPATAREVSMATGLDEASVRESLAEFANAARAAEDDPAKAAAEVRQGVEKMYADARAQGLFAQRAAEIQPEAATAAWITFGALALSLATAIFGGMMGRRSLVPAVDRPDFP
jgi:hypothetical protein